MENKTYKSKLGFTITDNTTFAGKDSADFYKNLLTRGLIKENVTLMPGVKSKENLYAYNLGNVLQAEGDASFANSGEGTLSASTVTVCPLKSELAFPTTFFENNYMSLLLKAGSGDAQIVPTFEEFVKNTLGEQISSDLEKIWVSGTTGSATYPYSKCDGIITKFSGSAVSVTAIAASAITKSTVVAELDRILAASLQQVRDAADFQIFVSSKIALAYRQYVGTVTADMYGPYGSKVLDYIGYKLIETPSLADNMAFAGNKSNFILATDLISDFEDIYVKNMFESSLVRETRMSAHLKFGAACPKGAEVVWYK